ncbi:uncharacterized protein LOC110827512 isoform X2 [Zootermopsis nevadensis]|nr:uncharacterized protein LOC110827512 isoform X2 [Zootermopsis nevadensis]
MAGEQRRKVTNCAFSNLVCQLRIQSARAYTRIIWPVTQFLWLTVKCFISSSFYLAINCFIRTYYQWISSKTTGKYSDPSPHPIRMDVSGDVTSLRKKAVIISFSPFDSGLSEADHFSAFVTTCYT